MPTDRIVRTDWGHSCSCPEYGGYAIIFQMREQNKRVTPCVESTGPARRGSRRFITRFVVCATVCICGSLQLISVAYTTSNGGNTFVSSVYYRPPTVYIWIGLSTWGTDYRTCFCYIYIYIYICVSVCVCVCVCMCVFIYLYLLIYDYGLTACEAVDL